MQDAIIKYDGNDIATPLVGGHRVVPVKTICEIIDVDYSTQHRWLKKHEIFSQVLGLAPIPGADGKKYDMASLPMIAAFGWLVSISQNNRKDGSVEKQNQFIIWFLAKINGEISKGQADDPLVEAERELVALNRQDQEEVKELEAALRKKKQTIKARVERIEQIQHDRRTGQIRMNLLDSPIE